MIKFIPTNKRVLLSINPLPAQSDTIIIRQSNEMTERYLVAAVGNLELNFKVGDSVLVYKNVLTPITIGDTKYFLAYAEDILGIMT